MCWLAAQHQWQGYVIDVKTAFLNASMSANEESQLLLVAPPVLLVEKGLLQKGVMYVPEKAIYGLRRSPRLWGDHRDRMLEEMEVSVEEEGKVKILKLEALASEQNLWRILSQEEELQGLLMTYVDDIFVVGSSSVATAMVQRLQQTWTTSPPERVAQNGVKLLGMEVKVLKGDEGLNEWHISQRSYLTELLGGQDPPIKPKKLPITKDQAVTPKDEGLTDPESVRMAQKIVGELLWVVTRTRPDVMFSVSRMASSVLSGTQAVKEAGAQTKAYL